MDQRANFLALILLDALEDENESDVYNIVRNNSVDCSFVAHERGIAPLHYACGMPNKQMSLQFVKLFLSCGANPNVRSHDNMTPLHVAALFGREEVVDALLKHGAELDCFDDECKSPVQYAIEELHFEVVQTMRNHILMQKYKRSQQRQQKKSDQCFFTKENSAPLEDSLKNKEQSIDVPGKASKDNLTPNKLYYNYDVTSPYYINITHRRGTPQPKFPDSPNLTAFSADKERTQSINIFTLTKDNLTEFARETPEANRSRISLIEKWRNKVQNSRVRQSILKTFDDINDMIDNVVEDDNLNFTNTVLNEKEDNEVEPETNAACGSNSSSTLTLEKLIRKVQDAHIVNDCEALTTDRESSFRTAPELVVGTNDKTTQKENTDESNFIRSPSNAEYFLQMAEAYVHTDDENGLAFYETKLLTNPGNKIALLRNNPSSQKDSTFTSHSTDVTIPLDYETDELRAELTTFGDPPGPITKSTKRLYIKRLIKYKRNISKSQTNQSNRLTQFSVELQRTVRSLEGFQRIPEFMKLETESMKYFANTKESQKAAMREGRLKQSFIYMLIDPRVSCNLPGESVYLEKFEVWKRFLQSIFYVGKGKSSRPYSHLYDAMKAHARLNNNNVMGMPNVESKKISMKKTISAKQQSLPTSALESKKLNHILDIWASDKGVVCLHVFHNIMPSEAYTREAAVIDALSLQHLSNMKRGNYYGVAKTWTMKEKKYLGIALLYKALQIYIAEGESQLSPSDLI